MKLYILVDETLPVGSQAAQACHALREFVAQCPEDDRQWYTTSNTVVLLRGSQQHLERILCEASDRGVSTAVFHEPDLGGARTALATTYTASWVRSLKLVGNA